MNVSSRHPLLPAGHEVHPGGARLHGLRSGISTIGKTIGGLQNVEMRQHRLAFSMKSIQAPAKLVKPGYKRQVGRCHHQPESLTAVLTFFTDFQQLRSHSC